MEKSSKNRRRRYSADYRLSVLLDYYSSQVSKYRICKKYGISLPVLNSWIRLYESEDLSLPSELTELSCAVSMVRKQSKRLPHDCRSSKSEVEQLREEVVRLRKALSYSELRNVALHEVLKIGKEQYGVDLLKKLVPSSRQPSTAAPGT